jgi:hypothetical protein
VPRSEERTHRNGYRPRAWQTTQRRDRAGGIAEYRSAAAARVLWCFMRAREYQIVMGFATDSRPRSHASRDNDVFGYDRDGGEFELDTPTRAGR